VQIFSLAFGVTAVTHETTKLGLPKFGMELHDKQTYTLQQGM
jgi:hypothetical protein